MHNVVHSGIQLQASNVEQTQRSAAVADGTALGFVACATRVEVHLRQPGHTTHEWHRGLVVRCASNVTSVALLAGNAAEVHAIVHLDIVADNVLHRVHEEGQDDKWLWTEKVEACGPSARQLARTSVACGDPLPVPLPVAIEARQATSTRSFRRGGIRCTAKPCESPRAPVPP